VPHLARDARILDIGCATGGLLSLFKKRGFEQLVGADPSPACAEIARRLYGIEVRAASLIDVAEWTETFDLILMVGVLEHLRDVLPAVKIAASKLSPNGFLYLAVPDVEGLAECYNAPFQQFSMEHINFFSAQSLALVSAAAKLPLHTIWQYRLEWREGIIEPIVSALCGNIGSSTVGKDVITEPALQRYVAWSNEGDLKINDAIGRLASSGTPLLIWGIGALTRRLLISTALASANIVAFVDSDQKVQGREALGKKVISPQDIRPDMGTIFVCSFAFEKEIIGQIRNTFHFPNPVVSMSQLMRR
jgi:SAM-dependent methyltransferase